MGHFGWAVRVGEAVRDSPAGVLPDVFPSVRLLMPQKVDEPGPSRAEAGRGRSHHDPMGGCSFAAACAAAPAPIGRATRLAPGRPSLSRLAPGTLKLRRGPHTSRDSALSGAPTEVPAMQHPLRRPSAVTAATSLTWCFDSSARLLLAGLIPFESRASFFVPFRPPPGVITFAATGRPKFATFPLSGTLQECRLSRDVTRQN